MSAVRVDAQRLRTWRARLRVRTRTILWARRVLASALLLAAVIVGCQPGVSAGEHRVPTLVAAADLASGTALRQAHVRVVELPGSARPSGAYTEPGQVDGRLLAGATRAGEPLTDRRVVEPDGSLAGVIGPDSATVPIRLGDGATARLLHPGAKVDVVAPQGPDQQRQVLVSLATVVTVVDEPARADGRPDSRDGGPLVLIAVPVEAATQVAGVSLSGPLAVTLR